MCWHCCSYHKSWVKCKLWKLSAVYQARSVSRKDESPLIYLTAQRSMTDWLTHRHITNPHAYGFQFHFTPSFPFQVSNLPFWAVYLHVCTHSEHNLYVELPHSLCTVCTQCCFYRCNLLMFRRMPWSYGRARSPSPPSLPSSRTVRFLWLLPDKIESV